MLPPPWRCKDPVAIEVQKPLIQQRCKDPMLPWRCKDPVKKHDTNNPNPRLLFDGKDKGD